MNLLSRAQADASLKELAEIPRLTIQLLLEVLEDLVRIGWLVDDASESGANGSSDSNPGCLIMIPPDAVPRDHSDRQEIKRRLRASLVEARNEQLRDPQVRKFLAEMERPREVSGTRRSVQDLFASPSALVADLRNRMSAPKELREDLLHRAVKPYLQQVTDEKDKYTGLRLRDIWRYCRYTWSLPYNTQPGRRIHYLVRDAARAGDPIMGIGALGNSMVQITCRDNEIGWTIESLQTVPDLDRRVSALYARLRSAIKDIHVADLLEEGLLSQKDLEAPSAEVVDRLEKAAAEVGLASVRHADPNDAVIQEATRTPRYRRKRIVKLSKWLEALRIFGPFENGESELGPGAGTRMMKSPEGRRALKTALRLVKQQHIGTSMMDITTCGAIPPYGPLLGGKLVGLLLASPQVISDYRSRYRDAESHIASRMAGTRVVRPPDLVLLCTTSLYYVGSSQYNRLRAPTANGELRYRRIGETLGYGSVHLSRQTYRTLQRLLSQHPDLERQSNRFAAGVNYKLRSISAGLSFLGLGALQKHKTPRLVYVIPLATNWRRVLVGDDVEPAWIYSDINTGREETKKLVEYWKSRWFIPRVQRSGVLKKLDEMPSAVRVSAAIHQRQSIKYDTQKKPQFSDKVQGVEAKEMPDQKTVPWTTLAEMVLGRASFAERLTTEELEIIHVPTRLDAALLPTVSSGVRIFLSGNPGDGKTHIIRRNLAELKGVFTNLDASATDETALIGHINTAIHSDDPLVVAINEGPLRNMRNRLDSPDREILNRQLDQPFVYGDEEPDLDALLVNLGVRQLLDRSIVESTLSVVLNRVEYRSAPTTVRSNCNALADERIQSRLFKLLELAAQGGTHITMHQLFGFFSFIITGGKSVKQADQLGSYFDLVFREQNPLYPALFTKLEIDTHGIASKW